MFYPNSLDSFTTLKNKGDSVTESHTLTASAVAFTITVGYGIMESVSFSAEYSTEVTTTPAAGQFRVYYRTSEIELGPLATGVTVNITYTTSGSLLFAGDINALNTAVGSIESTLGLTPQGTSGTVAARLDALSTSMGLFMEVEDFTSQLTGTDNVFSLMYEPVNNNHVMVTLNGLALKVNVDYIVDTSNVVLSEAPYSTDTLEVRYFRSI